MTGLLEILTQALSQAAQNLHNGRRGNCSVEQCPNDVYATGLCNAHYIRKRKGKTFDKPLQSNHGPSCTQCEAKINLKGGWGLCANHYKSARFKVIKQAAVTAYGGKCNKCQIGYPLAVYDFHHKYDKEHSPSQIISSRSIATVASELEKCVLLCANCHRMEHHEDKL